MFVSVLLYGGLGAGERLQDYTCVWYNVSCITVNILFASSTSVAYLTQHTQVEFSVPENVCRSCHDTNCHSYPATRLSKFRLSNTNTHAHSGENTTRAELDVAMLPTDAAMHTLFTVGVSGYHTSSPENSIGV